MDTVLTTPASSLKRMPAAWKQAISLAMVPAWERFSLFSNASTVRMVMRRERLVYVLAMEPNRTHDDVTAKLAVLCCRLRLYATPGASWRMANYQLAEGARNGLPG